jgi:hypothetical protein
MKAKWLRFEGVSHSSRQPGYRKLRNAPSVKALLNNPNVRLLNFSAAFVHQQIGSVLGAGP